MIDQARWERTLFWLHDLCGSDVVAERTAVLLFMELYQLLEGDRDA